MKNTTKSLIEVMVFCYDEGKTRAEALASHPDLDVVIRPQRREFDDVVVEVYSDLRIPSIDLEEISMVATLDYDRANADYRGETLDDLMSDIV